MRPRPAPLAALLCLTLLTGCLDGGDDDGTAPSPLSSLEVYRFTYPGADLAVEGHPHGWLARVHNPTDHVVALAVEPFGVAGVIHGPVADDGTWPDPRPTLAPGESVAWLFRVDAVTEATNGFRVHAAGGGGRTVESATFWVNATTFPAVTPVRPGDHVRTLTVGVWANGTSFYTNVAALNADPAFPAGYDRTDFGGEPLPIYVYGESGSEQPAGSRDTCHFVTIAGYNALLKEQARDATGVRALAPAEAYTRPGAEDHPLYGDALVFLNTVVAHDGATGTTDAAPDPTGECFDPGNSVPLL